MQITYDFVSNSSSVSYIITMKKEIVELFARHYESNKEIQRITEFIKEDISDKGTRVYMDGEDLLFKKVEFQTDDGTNCRKWIEGKEKK
ncbi:MAG: hypothetical protein JKX79_02785 [Labilibaculum sp.]|nr:hypothetical protein [Labilibaculum sp.]